MPVVVIMQMPALPPEQRDELARRANLRGDPPDGLLLHASSGRSDEPQLSVEVWETNDHLQRFLNERMLPVASSVAEEFGSPTEMSPATLTTVCVLQPGIAVKVVNDFGDEIRRLTDL